MSFRPLVSLAVLSSGLFLGACNSSDSPTANPKDSDPDTSTEFKANGTLTVYGKSFPAHVSGLYNDTSVTLTVLANLNALDTGWTVSVQSRPSQGLQPVKVTGTTLNVTHRPTTADSGCVYTVKSGSATFDAWTLFMAGQYEMARLSGSVSLELTRWFLVTDGCPDLALSLSFANAEATHLKAIDGILE